ncbi:MAG: hypothetical protein MJ177_09290 [Clostridia bacterium]|nr:hypothetical protein [Clostridia bacterium]
MDVDSQYKFKSSFAGFKREDVICYIEKISNDFFDYRKESEATVKELQQRIELLENRINELASCADRQAEEHTVREEKTEEPVSENKEENKEKKDELLDNFDIQFIEQLKNILADY